MWARMMTMFVVIGLGSFLGCSEQPSRETVGTGAGAVIGGVIGREVGDGTTGTVIGGVIGAIAGREIGRRMDEGDRRQAYTALEQNEPVNWQSDSGERYSVTPTETFTENNRTCRNYETTVVIDNTTETATGKACRRDDGTWEIVS